MNNSYENQTVPPKNKLAKLCLWLFIAIAGALLIANLCGDLIKNIFNALLSGLTPIIFAIVVAFLLLEPIKWIENKLLKNAFVGNPRAKKYKRIISLTTCYTVIILVIVLILALAVPYVVAQLQDLIANQDTYIYKIEQELTELVTSITSISDESVQESVRSAITSFINMLNEWVAGLQEDIANIVGIVTSTVFTIIMGIIISCLMLKDKELIASLSRRYTYAYNSKKKADEIIAITRRSSSMLNQYLISNLFVMFIVFVVSWIGYTIIGVPMAFISALLLGLLSIIPYIGGFIAIIPVVLLTLVFGSVTQAIIAVAFGLISWAAITTFIPPIIFSKRMSTRAIVIILALILGGAMFGFWGMILSAPVVSMIAIIMQERLEIREAQREREELIDAGVTEAITEGVADMLDLKLDLDPSLLDIEEEINKQTVKKFKKPQHKVDKVLKVSKSKDNKNEQIKNDEQILKQEKINEIKDDEKEKPTKLNNQKTISQSEDEIKQEEKTEKKTSKTTNKKKK